MKKDNAFTKFIKLIKELRKTANGRAVLFFGFYFIFFLILIVILKYGNRNPISRNEYETASKYSFTTTAITNNNYHFIYTINIDNNTLIYEGDKYKNQELFTVTTSSNIVTYYEESNDFYLKENNTYTKAENPYKLEYFLNNNNLSNIISNLTYISKTTYDSGKEQDNFQISTATLMKLISNTNIDISDTPNEASFTTDENKNLVEINYNLSSYAKYQKIATTTCNIIIKYSNFGNIKEINRGE